MTDFDQEAQVPVAEQQTEDAPQPSEEAPTPVADSGNQTPDWSQLINDVPTEELRRHPKLSGLVGSMLARQRAEIERATKAAEEERAREAAAAELERLARDDPDEFSRRYLTDLQRQRQQEEAERQRAEIAARESADARIQYAELLGTVIQKQPDFAPTDEERAQIAEKLKTLPPEQAISGFMDWAVGLITRTRVEREKKALEASVAGASFSAGPPIGAGRVNGTGTYNDEPTDIHSPEWDAWYRRSTRQRR